jgi:hypothetical protein
MFVTNKKEYRNMKLQSTALVLLLAILTLAGCQGGPFCMRAKGDEVTETISMADFDGIELAIDGNVTLHRDSVRQVKITGHQNIIDNIERNIKSGSWVIEYDECVIKSGKLEIEIWLPSLTEVKITGSGNITGLDQFPNTSSLDVAITGSGNIDLDADADVVKMSVTGSGDIDLGTTANRVEASITGSGNIDVRGTCSHEDIEIMHLIWSPKLPTWTFRAPVFANCK